MECWISKLASLPCQDEWKWRLAVAGISAIAGWFTNKFFLGRKIDELRQGNSSLRGKIDELRKSNFSLQNEQKSQSEIDFLLWVKDARRSSKPPDEERMFTVIFEKKYPYIFPLEVLMSGSEIEERIDEFLFLIRMHGYKKADKMMREKYK